MSACLKFVQRVQAAFVNNGGHDAVTWAHPSNKVSILEARPGFVKVQLTLAQHNVNRLGSMHGGLIGTLTDTMGSLAIASKGFYSTGVSTDISTTFVKAAGKAGDSVIAEAQVISLGKTLAYTRMELKHPVTNALLAYGSHTKFMGKASGHEENVEFDETGEKILKGKKMEEWDRDISL